MSDKYTLVHEGLSQWINSPNNGGECCQTWADTVDELNHLLARIKRLEEAVSIALSNCYDGPMPEYVRKALLEAKETQP